MTDTAELIILFVFFFCGMTAFALLINSILLRFVKTLGTKNQPGAIVRWSEETKPAIGGLAFFIIFLISICVYAVAFDPNYVFSSAPILGLLVAGTMGFILGLTDDAYNTRPVLKFTVQVICGIILLITGTKIEAFEYDILNNILTVVWVIGIMNSINMLDNMDGISTSVSIFIILAALGYIILHGGWMNVDFLVLIGLLASLIGFLFYNWNPSTMYMGDTGSQFLGVILGYIGINYCWNAQTITGESNVYFAIAALVLVFILPLSDTITVTINRLRRGQSPFVGGKDHTTHHLSYRGLTDRKVAVLYCIISGVGLILYLWLIHTYESSDFSEILLGYIFFLLVFLSLYGITIYNQKRNIGVETAKEFPETEINDQ